MAQISIDRVVSVSLLAALKGLANANTSALAIITDEVPIGTYGSYGVYYSPDGVATDFGSASDVYAQAVAIFSQSPNILSGGGFLVIIPRDQAAAASAATILGTGPVDLTKLSATDYTIKLAIDGGSAADVSIGGPVDATSLATATTSLNPTALSTAGAKIVLSGTVTAATISLQSLTTGATSDLAISAAGAGTDLATALGLSGSAVGTASGLESIKDCILRTNALVYYFGILYNVIPSDSELPELAALVQALDKMQFYAEYQSSKIAGIVTTLMNSGFTNSRAIVRIDTEANALLQAAEYASRALSVDFTGSNTVATMHLKDLVGLPADPGMTETLVTACQNAGADVYCDFGVPKVFTSGANGYFDAVYIALAFKLAIRVAGFNFLAQTATKIPQTEIGMNGLKGAYRSVIKQFVNNGAFAPGAWNGTTFGNPEDFVRNIAENGYYIYSLPLAQQTQTVRASRAAPLVQIACKSAGAIHSSNVFVFIEP